MSNLYALVIFILLIFCKNGRSQDVIYTIDGRKINAEISDIDIDYIYYTDDGVDQIDFTLDRKMVDSVRIKDEKLRLVYKETYKVPIEKFGERYRVDYKKLVDFESIEPYLKKDFQAYTHYNESIRFQKKHFRSLLISSGCFIGGVVIYYSESFQGLGVLGMLISGAILPISYSYRISADIHKQKALDKYGVDYISSIHQSSPELSLGLSDHGVGLVLHF